MEYISEASFLSVLIEKMRKKENKRAYGRIYKNIVHFT
mgnify:CR=1 FL=1